jgi:hypothetical protein
VRMGTSAAMNVRSRATIYCSDGSIAST